MRVADLLLDTCAAVFLAERAPMREPAISAIRECVDAERAILISPWTAWEVGMLVSRGRLAISRDPQSWFSAFLSQDHVELAPMPPSVLISSSFLPEKPDMDPADCIFAATAREYGFTLVTRDRALLDYAAAGHINAIEC
jgi:PIN domain nuclease of toxin-antitoxin system